jgi:L-amino acid N-acyltransferase YncA
MAEPEPRLRAMTPEDWPRVRAIYEEGIATGDATFETRSPSWDAWNSAHLPHPRLIATVQDEVLGWAALSPISTRSVYAGVAEVSVYVAAACRGQGIGIRLLAELIRQSEVHGIWTLQAGIFPENGASLRLHAACGFSVVGTRERLGEMHGRWRDVVLLERRSRIAGSSS